MKKRYRPKKSLMAKAKKPFKAKLNKTLKAMLKLLKAEQQRNKEDMKHHPNQNFRRH